MGKEIKKRKTLWMRYVDFNNVKDILHIVYQNDGKLRAGDLEQLAIKKGILLKKGTNKPLTHTPRYHYRKVMEGLGLVELKHKFYYVSSDSNVLKFINLTSFKEPMPFKAKEILRKIVVENMDCQKYFFDIFMKKRFYTFEELRESGSYVVAETESMRKVYSSKKVKQEENNENIRKRKEVGTILFKNSLGKIVELKTQDEIHAIYWGVRLWSLTLGITNEILMSFKEGRIIYPVNPNFSDRTLMDFLFDKVKTDKSDSEWVVLHIPTFIKEVALLTRFSVDRIKNFLENLKIKYPLYTMFIPSSTMFIDMKTPYERQDSAIYKTYLYRLGMGYISHIRINRKILKEAKYE